MRYLPLLLALISTPAFAASARAVSPEEVGSVSIIYAIAALCLLVTLAGAQWLVSRR